MEFKPTIIGYCKMDDKGRITVPKKTRLSKKGFLLAQYEGILILVNPNMRVL